MTGRLVVVGTGPGNPEQTTPEALTAIEASHVFFGYGPYLDRLTLRSDQRRVASDNREELARAKDAGLVTKSGIIVGMGETDDEVRGALVDLRSVGVDIVTIGQYLRPTARHLPVAQWWHPDAFAALGDFGASLGFGHVESGPLVRSSYHARSGAEAATPPTAGARAG